MIGRRPALLGAAGLLCTGMAYATPASALPVPSGNHLGFRIIRKGSAIGTHVVEFVPEADALTVNIAVDIVVGIGPIALFRYTHRAMEHWRGHGLEAMETRTNDDGTQDHVSLRRGPTGLTVESSRFPTYIAPSNALPGSHWNEKMLDGPAINTQHGKLLRPRVTMLAEEPVPDASGRIIEARHFAVRGDANIDTWYDDTPCWVALRFIAHEGSEIRYERM
jgi:hypothetical protein